MSLLKFDLEKYEGHLHCKLNLGARCHNLFFQGFVLGGGAVIFSPPSLLHLLAFFLLLQMLLLLPL